MSAFVQALVGLLAITNPLTKGPIFAGIVEVEVHVLREVPIGVSPVGGRRPKKGERAVVVGFNGPAADGAWRGPSGSPCVCAERHRPGVG